MSWHFDRVSPAWRMAVAVGAPRPALGVRSTPVSMTWAGGRYMTIRGGDDCGPASCVSIGQPMGHGVRAGVSRCTWRTTSPWTITFRSSWAATRSTRGTLGCSVAPAMRGREQCDGWGYPQGPQQGRSAGCLDLSRTRVQAVFRAAGDLTDEWTATEDSRSTRPGPQVATRGDQHATGTRCDTSPRRGLAPGDRRGLVGLLERPAGQSRVVSSSPTAAEALRALRHARPLRCGGHVPDARFGLHGPTSAEPAPAASADTRRGDPRARGEVRPHAARLDETGGGHR